MRTVLVPIDGLSSPTGPPSVPRNLSFSVSGTQLSLRWEPPVDLGGREDVRYDVGCSQCRGAALDGEPCQPCGGSVRFSPGPSGLTSPTVCVDGLEPDANYTFNVEAQNGVSELGASKPASALLSVSMGRAGEGSRGPAGPGGGWRLEGVGPQGQIDEREARRGFLSDFLPLDSQRPRQACP